MKIQRLLMALTIVNLVLLIFILAQMRPATAQRISPVLRGRSLEIVDEQGKLRAFLGVLPASPNSTQPNGKSVPETVILRLMDPNTGRPSVKLATSNQGSGLGLLGESRTHGTWVILEADGQSSVARLKNEDGQEQRLKP